MIGADKGFDGFIDAARAGIPAVLQWLTMELVRSEETEEAARAQALRSHQAELERIQARLDVLYDDRLDGRIDAATYERKAGQTHAQQVRIQTEHAA